MAKGTKSIVYLLLGLTFSILLFFSIILGVFVKLEMHVSNPCFSAVWTVITHILDPGTLGNNETSNLLYILLLFIITIFGIILNSVLIGAISNAIDNKLEDLQKGNSKIIEENHTIIIGFNEATFTMINELIKANENQKKSCIVLLSNTEIDKMKEQLSYNIETKSRTEIICRTGDTFETNLLDICSLTSAKSVIINHENDFDTIKQIMVITKYLEQKGISDSNLNITAYITKKDNIKTAQIAGKGNVNVLFFEDSISRLIAHSCRYPGISSIFVDFFDFDGDEIYYEAFPEIDKLKFRDIIISFNKSSVIGLVKSGIPLLNPPMDTIYDYKAGDKVIHIAEDDNTSYPSKKIPEIKINEIEKPVASSSNVEPKNMLVLGYNSMLEKVLQEYNNYVGAGSEVIVAMENDSQQGIQIGEYSNLNVSVKNFDITNYEKVEELFTSKIDTVLILCNLNNDINTADSLVMMLLLFVRDIIEKKNLKINVISEMRSIVTQKIATDKNISDFVVGSNITSLVLSQISENPDLLPVFAELLDESGSELYMRPVTDYIATDIPVDIYQLQKIAEKRSEIVIGYKRFVNNTYSIILNPAKNEKTSFCKDDLIIVLAND